MPAAATPGPVAIAVVGVSAIMPGATDAGAFWRNIVEGRDLIEDVPPGRWLVEDHYDPDPRATDKTYSRRGAFLPEVNFDPMAFGIPPNILEATDTAQLLTLVAAARALSDAAGGRAADIDGERVSVILGNATLELASDLVARLERPILLKVLRERGIREPDAQAICDQVADHHVPFQEASFPGILSNVVAGRIANRFDLHGTNVTVDAACASSLAALSMAMDELVLGRADLVITGGVDTVNDPMMYVCFSKTPALSPSGDCRPFSNTADGIVLGEGLALFVLKRLADAERDGDQVYAVIRGLGSSSDGRASSIYGPLACGQERALRRAYAAAGYGPDTVGLVEAHGTGTAAGDGAEAAALHAVFGEANREGVSWCALGSVKSQIGHTKAAAGAAGLLKAVLAVHHKVLPPTIKVDRPNVRLGLESGPLYLNTTTRPWVHHAGHPRRASVSSFGFGGANFHVTLEEYVPHDDAAGAKTAPRTVTRPTELVPLSAESPQALGERCTRLIGQLRSGIGLVADTARRAQQEFVFEYPARVAVVTAAPEQLADQLQQAVELLGTRPQEGFSTPTGIHYGIGTGTATTGRIGFLFPGQGAQYVGMGADLAVHLPAARAVWDRAGALVPAVSTLADVVFPPPAFGEEERARQQQQLTATEWAQPALAVHALALLEVLDQLGVRPDCVAGHSFGELVALHAARALDAKSLVRLACRRGEFMREAAKAPGAMLAIEAGYDRVVELLAEHSGAEVWIANDNGPHQVVVSGSVDAITALRARLTERRLAARGLEAAAAFHSPLVAAATEPLLGFLQEMTVRAPLLDVYSGADAGRYPLEPDGVRRIIASQLASPVRFSDTVNAMYDDGVRIFVEVGPGTAITGLVGDILAGQEHQAIAVERRGRHGITSLNDALARLVVSGICVTFDALWKDHTWPAPCTVATTPQLSVPINGSNYGRRYPPQARPGAPQSRNPVAAATSASAASEEQGAESPASTQLAAGSPSVQDNVVQALLEAQRQTAQAHAAYLRTAESAMNALFSLAGNDAPPLSLTASPEVSPSASMPVSSPATIPSSTPNGAGSALAAVAPGEAITSVSGSHTGPASTDVAEELESLVLVVIAEMTGYPVEILRPHMELEADLGIDSITRVQILAELANRLPWLTEKAQQEQFGAAPQLASLRTAGDVASAIRELNSADTAADPAEQDPGGAGGIVRQVTIAVRAAAEGQPMPGLGQGLLVITPDVCGVAHPLAATLVAHGVTAKVTDDVPANAYGVVILTGLADIDSPDEALAIQRQAFRTTRKLAAHMAENGGLLVMVQDTGGRFGPCSPSRAARAWSGGLAALARTAAVEWPKASVKAIDCDRGGRHASTIAEAIADELLHGAADPNVGLDAHGTRYVLDRCEAPVVDGRAVDLGPEDVLLVTGGGRGITATAVRELARSSRRTRFVLIGRTPLTDEPAELLEAQTQETIFRRLAELADTEPRLTPADLRARTHRILAMRDIRATLAALEDVGCPVRYLSLDVRNADALKAALEGIRIDWGPVTGVVHGAGVPADQRLSDKTDSQFDEVFGTKTQGLRAVLSATGNDPLRMLCVFSSIAGRFGFVGQCDYAMANETLNHVLAAEHARRPGCTVRALQWGPWQGGMVTPPLRELLGRAGIRLIASRDGARAFVTELATGTSDPRVMLTTTPLIERMQVALAP